MFLFRRGRGQGRARALPQASAAYVLVGGSGMSSDRKPVWLDEDAHLILKQYAKFVKTSMTEVTSQLVLDHLAKLDGSAEPEAREAGASVVESPKAAAQAVPQVEETEDPNRYVETTSETRLEPPRPEPPAPPRRQRTPREENGEIRYLGGIWLV